MSKGEVLLKDRRGHILILTFNRPELRNAFNLDMAVKFGDALEEAEHDADVRVIVITGAGDKSFSAGADLKALAKGENVLPDDPVRAKWGFAGMVNHPITKPIIAAVNGTALGGGTEITLASDLAIAAETATFGLPEVKRGLVAGAGGAFRIVRQLPQKLAMELLLTGDVISAQRAMELGLVNQVVPIDKLMDTALALAERIAANAPLSVQASKMMALGIENGAIASEDEDWRLSKQEGWRVFMSEDAQEGPRAFAEKRAPVWQGK